MTIFILGAGIAGLTASRILEGQSVDHLVLEARDRAGGHASSDVFEGHFFDEGPHVLFSRDGSMLKFLGAPSPESYGSLAIPVNVWRGQQLKHPPFLDFASISDASIRSQLANSLVATEPRTSSNYLEWIQSSHGDVAAEFFTVPYTKKYWRANPEELDTDWIGSRVHAISQGQKLEIQRLLQSNELHLADLTGGSHYLTEFTYSRNGFWGLFSSLSTRNVRFSSRVTGVDARNKLISLSSGEKLQYSKLISTIPLIELCQLMELDFSVESLQHTSVDLYDLIVESRGSSPATWGYLLDEDCPISRVSFPDNFLPSSPSDANRSSRRIQAEVYFNSRVESAPDLSSQDVLACLTDSGLLARASKLTAFRRRRVAYANIIPLLGRANAVEELRRQIGPDILLAGRYGSWANLWTIESAREGYQAGAAVLREMGHEVVAL